MNAPRPIDESAEHPPVIADGMIGGVCPVDGHALEPVPVATAKEVHAAVEVARAAQPVWAATPLRDRIAALKRAAKRMLRERADVLALMREEVGKQHTGTGAAINEENVARFTGTPFHEGAIRFYKDIGIWPGDEGSDGATDTEKSE